MRFVAVSVLDVQADYARVMFADESYGVKTGCRIMADVEVDRDVLGRGFERVLKIFGRLELKSPVALEPRVAEPVVVGINDKLAARARRRSL